MSKPKASKPKTDDKRKILIVYALYATAAAIAVSGAFFSVYSLINNVTFKVLNTNVSGSIFGLVVLYFGVRHFLSVSKLRVQLYDPSAKFSWKNFKKQKTAKNR